MRLLKGRLLCDPRWTDVQPGEQEAAIVLAPRRPLLATHTYFFSFFTMADGAEELMGGAGGAGVIVGTVCLGSLWRTIVGQ